MDGRNTRVASYIESYKEICSSPSSKILFADQTKAVGIKWKNKLGEIDKVNPASKSYKKSKRRKMDNVQNDLSCGHLISHIIRSKRCYMNEPLQLK